MRAAWIKVKALVKWEQMDRQMDLRFVYKVEPTGLEEVFAFG